MLPIGEETMPRGLFVKNKRIFKSQDIMLAFNTEDDPWDVQRARRWLKRTGLGKKMGGEWVTTRAILAARDPEVTCSPNFGPLES